LGKKAKVDNDNLKNVQQNISDLSDTLGKLTDSIKPMMDITDLGKSIDSLKNMLPTEENIERMTKEHTESNEEPPCVTCVSLIELVKQYPNDSDLGKEMRKIYKSYQDLIGDTEE